MGALRLRSRELSRFGHFEVSSTRSFSKSADDPANIALPKSAAAVYDEVGRILARFALRENINRPFVLVITVVLVACAMNRGHSVLL
jgi:hypothetical protein